VRLPGRQIALAGYGWDQQEWYQSVIQYYPLVNIISDNHDFAWEQEWQHKGHFSFKFVDVVAIIAENPNAFERRCRRVLSARQFRYIQMIPVVTLVSVMAIGLAKHHYRTVPERALRLTGALSARISVSV
jgi:hypothetical protein